MNQLHYNSHLFLNSKYKILIYILIYFVIYLFFYSQNIIYCMTEDTSFIAEAKQSSRPIPGPNTKSIMRREIEYFIGEAEILEEKNQIIQTQTNLILINQEFLEKLTILNTSLNIDITEAEKEIQVDKKTIGNYYLQNYSKQSILETKLATSLLENKRLFNELKESRILLAESKTENDYLFSILEKLPTPK